MTEASMTESAMKVPPTRDECIAWVAERLENCERIARRKSIDTKEGWLEDALYFQTILTLLFVDGMGKP